MALSLSFSWFNVDESWWKRAATWALEMAAEALGSALLMSIISLWMYRDKPSRHPDEWVFVFLVAPTVLLFFVKTGYALTTALCRILWKNRGRNYAVVTAILYVLHSQILFLSLKSPHGMALFLSFAGAAVAFGCACAGNTLLARWSKADLDVSQSLS